MICTAYQKGLPICRNTYNTSITIKHDILRKFFWMFSFHRRLFHKIFSIPLLIITCSVINSGITQTQVLCLLKIWPPIYYNIRYSIGEVKFFRRQIQDKRRSWRALVMVWKIFYETSACVSVFHWDPACYLLKIRIFLHNKQKIKLSYQIVLDN